MPNLEKNPLYHPPAAPSFDKIKPEHAEAIPAIIEENRKKLDELLKQPKFTWDNFVHPLEAMDNRLSMAISPISHLFNVCSTEAWRKAYESIIPIISEYQTDLSQNEDLYKAFKAIREGDEFAELDSAQQKVITDAIQNFEHSGVALPADKKAKFKEMSLRLTELSTKFSNNVIDASDAWNYLITDESELAGLPDGVKNLMADLAKQSEKEGWLVTLDAPVVTPLLTYSENRALREKVYKAYNAGASDLGPEDGKFDNSAIISEILDLRQKMASLLGFDNYASLTVVDRMAKTSDSVFAFLEDLVTAFKKHGEKEFHDLVEFGREEVGIEKLEPWDLPFASEKLRQKNYAISKEEIRQYFPVNKVIDGLFAITKKLYNVNIKPNTTLSTWHEDVRTYDVLNEDGSLRAQFYFDLYARKQKQSGAWMDDAVNRFEDNGKIQTPVTYLTCNFTPPVGDEEAYLDFREVETLFHEFGHGLHHMLTDVKYYSVSGLNGVEWDAVEQPSQFMENFAYTEDGLKLMTAHKETGETLPKELFDKLVAAKNFQAAMMNLRQLEFALLDFRIHTSIEEVDVLKVFKEVRKEVGVTPEYENTRFPMNFSHIFAGGYAAGYYSYKWAEVLAADSFDAFKEEGIFNPKTGARFRNEILAAGASRPSLDSFVAFRGREPQVGALLNFYGIENAAQAKPN